MEKIMRTKTFILTFFLFLTTALIDIQTMAGEMSLVTFQSNRDGNFEIYVMDAHGKNQTRLTDSQGIDWKPAWAKDGKGIVFHSDRDFNYEIYLMDSKGRIQTNLTNNPGADLCPSWFGPSSVYLSLFSVSATGNFIATWGQLKGKIH